MHKRRRCRRLLLLRSKDAHAFCLRGLFGLLGFRVQRFFSHCGSRETLFVVPRVEEFTARLLTDRCAFGLAPPSYLHAAVAAGAIAFLSLCQCEGLRERERRAKAESSSDETVDTDHESGRVLAHDHDGNSEFCNEKLTCKIHHQQAITIN